MSATDLKLHPGAPIRYWGWGVTIVAVVLIAVLLVDVIMWGLGMLESQPQTVEISVYTLSMRIVFRCLTAIDFPIVQIWIGVLAGWAVACFGRRGDA